MSVPANPFTPHQPIDPIYFAGRIQEVLKINSALNQSRHQKTQHLLLTGDRGIGKTSLALYARYLAKAPNDTFESDFHFATAYFTVERDMNLDDICRGLTAALLDDIDRGIATNCLEKLKKLNLHFAVRVPGVGEVVVAKQDHGKEAEEYLQRDFVKAIEELWNDVKDSHNGILLIVDELHNLASFSGLGSFFKILSESWAVHGYRQIMFMAIGLPDVSARLSDDDPSASRIFSYVQLSRMTNEESIEILKRCLSESNKTIADDAVLMIAQSSGGFPYFLHQLGYDAFETDTDGNITIDDAMQGLIKSLVQFERMFFGKMYKSCEGKTKQKIVDELAEGANRPRTAADLTKKLRIKNIHQYLSPLEKDGIIEKSGNLYQLSSGLLASYVRLFKMLPRTTKKKIETGLNSAEPQK